MFKTVRPKWSFIKRPPGRPSPFEGQSFSRSDARSSVRGGISDRIRRQPATSSCVGVDKQRRRHLKSTSSLALYKKKLRFVVKQLEKVEKETL
jgi:hypothetical protein